MLQFSPKNSTIWQVAAFSLIYSSIIGIILRCCVFFVLLLTIILLVTNGSKNLPLFVFSLFGTYLMFEAFYNFKILKTKPTVTLKQISQNINLADLVSLDLARQLLLHPKWDTTADLLQVLYKNRKIMFVFNKAELKKSDFDSFLKKQEEIKLAEILQLAAAFAEKDGLTYIDNLSLLSALFSDSELLKTFLFEKELKDSDLINIIHWARTYFREKEDSSAFWEKPTSNLGLGLAAIWSGGWTLETEKYTREINSNILNKNSNYLVGRQKEISQIQNILSRSERRNVILLGQPGLGKTALVYSLAQKSISGKLPEVLRFKRFLELDVTSIIASAGEGDVEQRVKNILVEVSHAGDIVLFIPVIENLSGALEMGKFDISGLLSNSLKNINLQIIGTSDRSSFHQFIESKPAFNNNFETIDVSEPTHEEAVKILEEAAIRLENKNRISITYSAVRTAVELSERYMVDRVLPGKAIDILDEAVSAKSLQGGGFLVSEDVEKTISEITKIPVRQAKGEEKEKLLKLNEILHQRVIGQEEAISSISLAVQRFRTLKRESTKPNGVFLFLGPTGVGKTETAKALAEVYYGSENKIIRFDMSEFNQENSVYRLIGSPPGVSEYKEGGQLTEAVRVNPFNLILLDEIEKAHQKVLELFLAIFDEGRITDSSGRPISFTNSIITATSNAGAEFIRQAIVKDIQFENLKKNLVEKLLSEAIFKPEFLNRFDDIIVFKPLNKVEVEKIVALMISKLIKRLEKQDLAITISPEVITFLAQKGYDPQFGARPLQRTIQDNIEGIISRALLEGKLSRGSKTTITLIDNALKLS